MAPALRILTWNVWFGGHMFDERAAALIAELDRRRPHVVALQEVTPELLVQLRDAPWADAYRFSDVDGSTLGHYGVLTLARVPVRAQELIDLPSLMGRRLQLTVLDGGLTVATVHLESTADCGPERVAQLALIGEVLATVAGDAALVGDLNFTPDDAAETAALPPGFVDVWPALHPDQPGYTVDTDVNTMRYQVKSKRTHKRIDRVLVRAERWRPRAIERVGTAAIDRDGTFVSDHFGLEATLGID